jgi:DNA-binding transcriptional LysR family regulator
MVQNWAARGTCMHWDDLRVYLALTRCPSIRAAAESLGVSHSTVSRRLQALEAALGTTLFLRRADGFWPTETGSDLLAHAEEIESAVQKMQRDLLGRDDRLTGRLRVTLPPPLAEGLVMPMLAEFTRLYPLIDLEVIADYGFADLDRRHADLAIRLQREPDLHLVGRRLPEIAYCIYAAPHYVASHRFVGPEADAGWIIWSDQDHRSGWFRDTPFPDCRLGPVIANPMAQLAAAAAGLGMVYAPCFLGDADPRLVRVPGAGLMQDRPVWLLSHPASRSSQRVRVCVAFLAQAFASQRARLAGDLEALA